MPSRPPGNVTISSYAYAAENHQGHSTIDCAWHPAGSSVHSALYWYLDRLEWSRRTACDGSQAMMVNSMSKREQTMF